MELKILNMVINNDAADLNKTSSSLCSQDHMMNKEEVIWHVEEDHEPANKMETGGGKLKLK